ncbi:MAG TPA: hypothetical protein DCS93_19160 [Microscillaceae bacterium]|nr:hypothetical protein [Microscillaceae bacterium]
MKKSILFCTLLTLLGIVQLKAQNIPVSGKFSYTESLGKTAGGTGIFYTHTIHLKNTQSALYSVDGYQASSRLACKVIKLKANRVQLVFDHFGEHDMFKNGDIYKKGQKLMTLENKNGQWLVQFAKDFPMDQQGKTIVFKQIK